MGVMYVLDEPSIGLHQRDNSKLLSTLRYLRDLGNTVIIVEHDEEAINAADHIVDIGPGAGTHGGDVIASGSLEDIINAPRSLTGQFLSGKERGLLTCITGVSGSGKSTLINATLFKYASQQINGSKQTVAPAKSISGLSKFDKIVEIDQSPIGRTPRSNPATYTGIFAAIRDLFAGTKEARSRGYKNGRFSFNVKGGRCEACKGDGLIKVEMHFLPDVYVPCDVCNGKRYNRETLEIQYKGKSISDILSLTVEEAQGFFSAVPIIFRKLQTLDYILDEPTTGLHFQDVRMLLKVLHQLRDQGNTVLVIEHNLDVIKTADWIIDMGPEGGDEGGEIVVCGPPQVVRDCNRSYTGQYLKQISN